MTAWKRALGRTIWLVVLVMVAFRAMAGTALCHLYGEHDGVVTIEHRGMVAEQARSAVLDTHHGTSDAASDPDRTPHSELEECAESVYWVDEAATVTTETLKLPLPLLDLLAGPSSVPRPPLRHSQPTRVPPPLAHPPPARSPLDISPRLRI